MAEELIISGDADHGRIVGDQFFGVGNVGGEAVFFGDRASEGAQGYIGDNTTTQEDHARGIEINSAAEAGHKMFENSLLERSGKILNKLFG